MLFAMHAVRVPIALVCALVPAFAADLFPAAEMRDVASLRLKTQSPTTHKTGAGQELKRIDIEFTSFDWAGEEWRHRAVVLLPPSVPARYAGAGAIVSGGNTQYAEAAASMGIPTLMIAGANPGPHYGIPDEGNLMGYGAKMFHKTGDTGWIGYAWLGKIIVRAVTALGAVEGSPVERAVVTGCSKRGAASWIAVGFDDRIVGAYPACWNCGNTLDWLQLKAERWGLDYQPKANATTMAPAFITTRQQMAEVKAPHASEYQSYTDPFQYRDRIKSKKILYAAGTDDPLFPVMSDSVFLPRISGDIRIHLVPNAAHTNATPRHLTAWRMWLAHVLAGRDVPAITVSARPQDDRLMVKAQIETRTTVKAARVWYTSDDRGAYLKSQWQSVELDHGSAAIPAPRDRYTAYFVEVEDEDPATVPGVATTGIQERKPAR